MIKDVVGAKTYSVWTDMLKRLVPSGRTHRLSVVTAGILQVAEEILQFIKENNAASVAMTDRIIGCPHESGIDYPEGRSCPQCPFWAGRNRWTGQIEH